MAGNGGRVVAVSEPPRLIERGRAKTWVPSAAGLVGLYAARLEQRGVDLRWLIAERRAALDGVGRPATRRPGRATVSPCEVIAVGRGTERHHAAVRGQHAAPRRTLPRTGWGAWRPTARRRLATATIAAIVAVGGLAPVVTAQDDVSQYRYVVQPGDTVESVATMFGVDPAAILAASAVQNPLELTPSEVIVIPDPSQGPAEAAAIAAEREGTSPWVSTAHIVDEGETLASIAAGYGMTVDALSEFNGLGGAEIDALRIGQRLLIPTAREGAVAAMDSAPPPETASPVDAVVAEAETAPAEDVVAEAETFGAFVEGVPAYVQQRNLSCEYAAAFIMTSAFGAGVPEWVFIENVPQSENPHWGYRGDIDGWWGNTTDYGVYPEALTATLNANGFAADVFYSGGDAAALTSRIDAGLPVAVWLGFWGDTSFVAETSQGVSYALAPGYHVVVAYGYDEGGVYVSDPGRGEYRYFAWDEFTAMWSVLDGMSLAVAPL